MKELGTITNCKEIFALHYAASKDETRFHLGRIYFDKSKAFATDGHIYAEQSHDLDIDKVFSISIEQAKLLAKADYVFVYDNEGVITLKAGDIEIKADTQIDPPNVEALKPTNRSDLGAIRLNPYLVEGLRKALAVPKREAGFTFEFTGKMSPLVVKSRHNDKSMGLIMPLRS